MKAFIIKLQLNYGMFQWRHVHMEQFYLSGSKKKRKGYIKKNFTVNVKANILCLNFCCNASIKYRDTFCRCRKLGYHPKKAFRSGSTPPLPCSHRLVVNFFPPDFFDYLPVTGCRCSRNLCVCVRSPYTRSCEQAASSLSISSLPNVSEAV